MGHQEEIARFAALDQTGETPDGAQGRMVLRRGREASMPSTQATVVLGGVLLLALSACTGQGDEPKTQEQVLDRLSQADIPCSNPETETSPPDSFYLRTLSDEVKEASPDEVADLEERWEAVAGSNLTTVTCHDPWRSDQEFAITVGPSAPLWVETFCLGQSVDDKLADNTVQLVVGDDLLAMSGDSNGWPETTRPEALANALGGSVVAFKDMC